MKTCWFRFAVEIAPHLEFHRIKEAKATLESIKIKDAKVNICHTIIVSGPVADRPRRASEALKAHKDVLCDRPIAMNIDSARELYICEFDDTKADIDVQRFALGRHAEELNRPGKSFSAVVMSLFSSASKIVCERVVPVVCHLCSFGSQDGIRCMRPTEVSSSLVQGKEHKAEINLLYPNGCVYTIYTALGLESVDTQSFSLSGERCSDLPLSQGGKLVDQVD
eukprot:767589-Hanusia_phi.AAC.2